MAHIKYDIRPRQAGKTYNLVKRSAQKKYPIICRFKEDCKRLKNIAKELGVEIPEPLYVDEILKPSGKTISKLRHTENVLVDEAECMLDLIINKKIGCHIDMMTLVTRNEYGHEINKAGEDVNVVYGGEPEGGEDND